MRKLALLRLPLLLALLLLSLMLLSAAASAKATSLRFGASPIVALAGPADDEEAGGDEAEAGEDDESEANDVGEDCGADEEEFCEEEGVDAEAEECVLEDATAAVAIAPGAGQVRLTIRYEAFEATGVTVDSSLRGGRGALHLGTERARFHRGGTYRRSFDLSSKQMPKALAAREFDVGLRAAGTPAGCELHLASRAPRRAR
ncbi:MAG: hypothetical protein ACJ76D_07070 [Solirubrobacterales bacterium]